MEHTRQVLPRPGQESVWDYPRPPRLERTSKRLEVWVDGVCLAATERGFRVLERSHPPVYYFPREDVQMAHLAPSRRTSLCEFKGQAQYYDVVVGDRRLTDVAWSYLDPRPPYEQLAGAVAFYAAPMDECLVDGERVEPQPGGFYGGWITRDVLGPFKGAPGSQGW